MKHRFRKLIEDRSIDILQPDVMWLGGLTELLKVAAMASAYGEWNGFDSHFSVVVAHNDFALQTSLSFLTDLAHTPITSSCLKQDLRSV